MSLHFIQVRTMLYIFFSQIYFFYVFQFHRPAFFAIAFKQTNNKVLASYSQKSLFIAVLQLKFAADVYLFFWITSGAGDFSRDKAVDPTFIVFVYFYRQSVPFAMVC